MEAVLMNPKFEDLNAEDQLVIEVFRKGIGNPNDKLRHDICGTPILLEEYGNTSSQYGWEIDHIHPESKGGASEIDNYQPLQ